MFSPSQSEMSAGSVGIGFAIPSNDVKRVLAQAERVPGASLIRFASEPWNPSENSDVGVVSVGAVFDGDHETGRH